MCKGLEGYKANTNIIQSYTCMCIERAFGIVKEIRRIIIRRPDIPLQHIADVVATFIVLYNIYN